MPHDFVYLVPLKLLPIMHAADEFHRLGTVTLGRDTDKISPFFISMETLPANLKTLNFLELPHVATS